MKTLLVWKQFVAIPLLLLSSLPDATIAWVTISRHSTQVSFHSNLDQTSFKLITTGVLYRSAFKDINLQGASDTDCYIAVGDIRGFDRAIFESPNLCTQFEIFPRPANEDVSSSNVTLPQGISVGFDVNQGMIATLDFYGEYADLTQTNPFNLPVGSFPVSVSSDSEGGVYVGMHDTGGVLPPPAPENENDGLRNIYEYYLLMTHPINSEQQLDSPKVVKVNMTAMKTAWEVEMATTEGRSTIAAVIHVPSRDLLIVSGSSNGKGSYVGAGAWSNSWDGYITKVNATSGEIDDSAASQTHLTAEHSLRIQSQVGQDDFIRGICASDDNIFVVGSTTGKMKADDETSENGGGFIMMLDVDTLNIQWTQQWHGLGVEGVKCVASSTSVYVAGHVPAGVSLKEDDTRVQVPAKDQDLFVALVDTADGSITWTRQIDSRRPDFLSNIVGTQVNDLILVANSLDFPRGRSDIYTFSMLKADGFYDWQYLPPDADPIRGSGVVPDDDGQTGEEDDNRTTVIIVATVVPAVVILAIIVYTFYCRSKPSSEPKTEQHSENNVTTTNETTAGTPPPSNSALETLPTGEGGVV